MICTISTFGFVLLFLIVGALFTLVALSVGKMFRPSHPNTEKGSTYECGEETIRGNWGKFKIRFYLIALIFVLFEVEIIFLFPWAKLLSDTELLALNSNWRAYALAEGLLFISILAIGLAYVWKKGLLNWQFERTPNKEQTRNIIKQKKLYETINERY